MVKQSKLDGNVFCGISCLLIGIPIHSHEQNIMVKKEDESYNFQYVILVETGWNEYNSQKMIIEVFSV